jgi:hypothetical protein
VNGFIPPLRDTRLVGKIFRGSQDTGLPLSLIISGLAGMAITGGVLILPWISIPGLAALGVSVIGGALSMIGRLISSRQIHRYYDILASMKQKCCYLEYDACLAHSQQHLKIRWSLSRPSCPQDLIDSDRVGYTRTAIGWIMLTADTSIRRLLIGNLSARGVAELSRPQRQFWNQEQDLTLRQLMIYAEIRDDHDDLHSRCSYLMTAVKDAIIEAMDHGGSTLTSSMHQESNYHNPVTSIIEEKMMACQEIIQDITSYHLNDEQTVTMDRLSDELPMISHRDYDQSTLMAIDHLYDELVSLRDTIHTMYHDVDIIHQASLDVEAIKHELESSQTQVPC